MKDTNITFKLTKEDKELFKQLAAKHDWSLSKWIYNALIERAKEEKDG